MEVQGINLEISRNWVQDFIEPDSILIKIARVVTWPLASPTPNSLYRNWQPSPSTCNLD